MKILKKRFCISPGQRQTVYRKNHTGNSSTFIIRDSFSPYSPDLASIDYYLVLALDNHIRNRQFQNRENLDFLAPKLTTYKNGIYKLVSRLRSQVSLLKVYVAFDNHLIKKLTPIPYETVPKFIIKHF